MLYVDGFLCEWMVWFSWLMLWIWYGGAFMFLVWISIEVGVVGRRRFDGLGEVIEERPQGVWFYSPTGFYILFVYNRDGRPRVRALGHLSEQLSERDPAGQLARARIGQVDGFPSLEPSTMVLSLRLWIGSSSFDSCLVLILLGLDFIWCDDWRLLAHSLLSNLDAYCSYFCVLWWL